MHEDVEQVELLLYGYGLKVPGQVQRQRRRPAKSELAKWVSRQSVAQFAFNADRRDVNSAVRIVSLAGVQGSDGRCGFDRSFFPHVLLALTYYLSRPGSQFDYLKAPTQNRCPRGVKRAEWEGRHLIRFDLPRDGQTAAALLAAIFPRDYIAKLVELLAEEALAKGIAYESAITGNHDLPSLVTQATSGESPRDWHAIKILIALNQLELVCDQKLDELTADTLARKIRKCRDRDRRRELRDELLCRLAPQLFVVAARVVRRNGGWTMSKLRRDYLIEECLTAALGRVCLMLHDLRPSRRKRPLYKIGDRRISEYVHRYEVDASFADLVGSGRFVVACQKLGSLAAKQHLRFLSQSVDKAESTERLEDDARERAFKAGAKQTRLMLDKPLGYVRGGNVVIPDEFADRMLAKGYGADDAFDDQEVLHSIARTDRQRQIIADVRGGKSEKEIAIAQAVHKKTIRREIDEVLARAADLVARLNQPRQPVDVGRTYRITSSLDETTWAAKSKPAAADDGFYRPLPDGQAVKIDAGHNSRHRPHFAIAQTPAKRAD